MTEKDKLSSRFKFENQVIEEPKESEILTDTPVISDIEDDFKQELIKKVDKVPVWFEYSKNTQKELIRNFVNNKMASEKLQIDDVEGLTDNLAASVGDFGAIQYLLDKDNISAVFVNGVKNIYIEISGKVLNTETKLTEEQLNFLINSIKKLSGQKELTRIYEFKTEKYYITVISDEQTVINIRKIKNFDKSSFTKDIMSEESFDFIASAIESGKNIIISGDVNSGKTALVNALISSKLLHRRIYVLENKSEITAESDNMVKLKIDDESKEKIISTVLKSSPDYIISDLNYVENQLTYWCGTLFTMRSPSVEYALKTIASAYINAGLSEKYAKERGLSYFDYIVQLKKSSDGSIKLASIAELTPEKLNKIKL